MSYQVSGGYQTGLLDASITPYEQPVTVDEDVTVQTLQQTGLDRVEELARNKGHDYAEAYLDQAVDTASDFLNDLGIDIGAPDIVYTPEAQELEDNTPLARYNPGDDQVEVIRSPDRDKDRSFKPSLLGVLSHELWHRHFEQHLRDRFGFIGRSGPSTTSIEPAFNDSYTGNSYMEDSTFSDAYDYLKNSAIHDFSNAENIYQSVNDTATMFDNLNDQPLDVDDTVPDVNLSGLDEAFAHVINLTIDGAVDDPGLRQDYWERAEESYNEQDEEDGIYDDRTGEFGSEIAVLGEYLAAEIADMDGGTDRLQALLTAEDKILDQGLLAFDPSDPA
ncbi:MAG: hypothetical protein SV186_02395 [Candidatus Nanohaloarchaea archaeon]|nr:hypothetical protein [Candidatus Nanohaloarchaea archaeon]